MSDSETPALAACRVGVTAEDLAREASRAILYGALLAAQRPGVRLKPAVAAAAYALLPAVRAFLAGEESAEAAHAQAYARACGAEPFLLSKRRAINAAATMPAKL